VKSWLIAVPLAGIMTVILTILSPQTTLSFLVINAAFMMLFIAAFTVFVLGLSLLNPAYSPKSVKLAVNVMIAIFTSIGLFAVSLVSLMRVGVWSETIEGLLSVHLLQIILSWLAGIALLYLGKIRVSRIE
jgi:hypothetical protein